MFLLRVRAIIGFRFRQCFHLAHIEPVLAIHRISPDNRLFADIDVKGDNREFTRPSSAFHKAEDRGGEDMYAPEGLQLILIGRIVQFRRQHLARREVGPAAKAVPAVHKQIAGCLAVVGKERGIGATLQMMAIEGGVPIFVSITLITSQ